MGAEGRFVKTHTQDWVGACLGRDVKAGQAACEAGKHAQQRLSGNHIDGGGASGLTMIVPSRKFLLVMISLG